MERTASRRGRSVASLAKGALVLNIGLTVRGRRGGGLEEKKKKNSSRNVFIGGGGSNLTIRSHRETKMGLRHYRGESGGEDIEKEGPKPP